MKGLEEHIKKQRLLLDSEHPREGHEKRFMQKLSRQTGPVISLRHALQVAASVAIIIASGFFVINLKKSGEKVAQQEIPASVMEAEFYYASEVNARYDRIRSFDFESSEEKALLLDELKELDTFREQLMADLEMNPDDGRIINALIRHYQIKLEIMDQIIIQLNQIKSETSEDHENESV